MAIAIAETSKIRFIKFVIVLVENCYMLLLTAGYKVWFCRPLKKLKKPCKYATSKAFNEKIFFLNLLYIQNKRHGHHCFPVHIAQLFYFFIPTVICTKLLLHAFSNGSGSSIPFEPAQQHI